MTLQKGPAGQRNASQPAGRSQKPEPLFQAQHFLTSENKILLIIILSISFSFGIVAWGIYKNYQSTLEENYAKFNVMITKVLASGVSERLNAPYSPALKVSQFLDETLAHTEDIAQIEVRPKNGTEPIIGRSPSAETDTAMLEDHIAPLVANINGENIDLGVIHIKFTKKTLKDIKNATSSTIIWVFLCAWFTSIFAVAFNAYILSKNLKTFVRGVKRLSTGDFGYKILENDLWGELKILATSFNDMSMRLRAYEDQNVETITFERNKLKAMLLSIADGVVVCDTQGKINIINDAACQLLGFKDSSWAIDTNIMDYSTIEGLKCFESVLKEYQEALLQSQGHPAHLHMPASHFSKTVELGKITLKVIVSPIQDLEGITLGLVMSLHDITRETEVDKLKTNFISNVSHELRTPVTTIKSYVDTIYNHGKDLDEETYKEFIETINLETDRLKKLVNDILDFSRLDEGHVTLEREWADITPVINLTTQSIKVLAEQKSISLTSAIESNLPKVYINSDAIERVIRNLLSNAIKYTPEGGRIKIRAEVSELADSLEVSVQDTGIGIPNEHLPFIFDRFYRVETKVHTIKGTGLGLHLVKIAVENHHDGEVFVKSDVGQGSTFGFRIPLHPPAAPSA
ncbi:MAG: ATP-binding protein [Vampirovibrionales bacterium]|nr:ATP-binding protein [Vampirovibrionales bacterium]